MKRIKMTDLKELNLRCDRIKINLEIIRRNNELYKINKKIRRLKKNDTL